MSPYQRITFQILLVAIMFTTGCKKDADEFFLGRPSDLAMLNGRILSGGQEEMLELLRVPSRFPNAENHHVASWQGAMIAWWTNAEKREVMKKSFIKVNQDEMRMLKVWLRVRNVHLAGKKDQILDEIEAALNSIKPNHPAVAE